MIIIFTIKLRCLHQGKNFSIKTDRENYFIQQDCDLEIEIEHNYQTQSTLKLFSILGMTAGFEQRVSILSIARNANSWRNYFSFCELHMKDNPYVENGVITSCSELCFNGDCLVNVGLDRKQFEFFQFYRSNSRQDFIFDNAHLDAGEKHDYWCSLICAGRSDNHHVAKWSNEPYLPIYRETKKYEFGCFGCSITRGTGIKKGSEWPALINAELGSVVNLAESGLGADGIFLNLSCALKHFEVDRVIILWPDLNRFCLRWRMDGWHLRMPLNARALFDSPDLSVDTIWLNGNTMKSMIGSLRDRFVSGWVGERSRRMMSRTLRLLSSLGIPAWHSSWSMDTYSYLASQGLGSHLLPPFFNNDRAAMDGAHPSSLQQRLWYESIVAEIGPRDNET